MNYLRANSGLWFLGLFGMALALEAAPVAVEFNGVDGSATPPLVSLTEAATRERAWVKVGGRFAGCEVRAYDAARHVVTLARETETWEVPLQAGVIAKAVLSDAERVRIERGVTNNLRQLSAAAEQFFLENGVSDARLDQLIGEKAYIKSLKPVDGEEYVKLALKQDVVEWVVVTKQGVEVRYKRQ